MSKKNKKTKLRERRHARIRAKIKGTASRPRLALFKSNTRIIAQLIDDVRGVTIAAVSDGDVKGKTKTECAQKAGIALAEAAAKKGVTKVVFDRGGFLYTGRVKAFADGARRGGLEF
ncbi:MAG: 50S ribosomal protein L18 [Patescibacteria group bacterium]